MNYWTLMAAGPEIKIRLGRENQFGIENLCNFIVPMSSAKLKRWKRIFYD